MVKFLTKLAEYFAKGLQIIGVFAPTFEKVLPGPAAAVVQVVSKDLTEMAQVILDAEQVGVALQLKGALRLESTPGRGTTATVWLPASRILSPAGILPRVAAGDS